MQCQALLRLQTFKEVASLYFLRLNGQQTPMPSFESAIGAFLFELPLGHNMRLPCHIYQGLFRKE